MLGMGCLEYQTAHFQTSEGLFREKSLCLVLGEPQGQNQNSILAQTSKHRMACFTKLSVSSRVSEHFVKTVENSASEDQSFFKFEITGYPAVILVQQRLTSPSPPSPCEEI